MKPAEACGHPEEFLSPGVTIDCNESLRLAVGDYVYSNLYRPMIQPINIFMHTKINPDGSLSVDPPLSKAGDKIIMKNPLKSTRNEAIAQGREACSKCW